MNIALVGCGLIGRKRAAVLSASDDCKLVIVADIDTARAEQLSHEYDCQATTEWEQVVSHPHVQVVVVSTVNKFLMPITVAALQAGKHVLCEKPLGRNAGEAQQMVQAARVSGAVLKTGFNHRHHPAVWKAHALCAAGAIGPLMYIRCVYGHGGRAGYGKEWRADPELAGGGELLDQGVHVIDLCRWFLGEFSEVSGSTATHFWELGYFAPGAHQPLRPARLEDNAIATLKTAHGQVAIFHTSWTQWKNRFTFEVFGRDGYAVVEGLGGSYGVERLTLGARRPEGGAPTEEQFEFPGPDRSWHDEWNEFTTAIREQREPLASGTDGLQAMRLIDAIYESARVGKIVRLTAND
jgi:predicted dehydrogenase